MAWTVVAEKVQGQLSVKVTGPAVGGPTYAVELRLPSKNVVLAQGTVSAASAAVALPLAVSWAQTTLDAWKTGLGA